MSVLALQWLDGFGWAGQAVFTWRILEQWLMSEKARRSVIPPAFWAWSLAGSALLLVYAFHRRDPVFVLGTLVNGLIYLRNFVIAGRGPAHAVAGTGRQAMWPVLAALALFAGITVEAIGPDHGLVRFDYAFLWLVVGFLGQVLWSGRFIVQWLVSERLGRSVLPASFFAMSLVGALLLFAYAVSRRDWVNMAAYGPNFIPYAPNLVLIRRERQAARAAAHFAKRAPDEF